MNENNPPEAEPSPSQPGEAPSVTPTPPAWHHPLTCPTPLSRVLTLALLLVLPFLGFWMGVNLFKPACLNMSVIEVEQSELFPVTDNREGTSNSIWSEVIPEHMLIDTTIENPRMNLVESWRYTNESLGFSIQIPNIIKPNFVVAEENNESTISDNTVLFYTNDNPDIHGPVSVFRIGAVSSSKFRAEFFLDKSGGDYFIRHRNAPFGLATGKYIGESDKHVFYFSKGQDCWQGNNCDIYAMTKSIIDTFIVTSAPHGTANNPSNQAVIWKNYFDVRSNMAFWYPSEWGEVNMENVSSDYEKIQNSPAYMNRIDSTKVQTERYNFSFANKQCGSDKTHYCAIDYQVRHFDKNRPIELQCYEGQCETLNLVEDSKMVEENYSFEHNGNKWLCVEGYFVPGGNIHKTCRAYRDNILFRLRMGYAVKDFDALRIIYDNKNGVTLDDAIGKVKDDIDYHTFRIAYEELLRATLLNL